jgi:Ferritin-like domain
MSEGVERSSRGVFVAAALGVGGGVFGAALVGSGAARSQPPSPQRDVAILNFALLLEHLQAAFYREALRRGRLRGEVRRFAEVCGANEEEHVSLLRDALGAKARPRPSFHFDQALLRGRPFVRAAVTLEEAGVAAYNGQAANLTPQALLPALRMVSVEGRHAAWIRDIAGEDPAPLAADPAESAGAVTSRLRRAGLLRIR